MRYITMAGLAFCAIVLAAVCLTKWLYRGRKTGRACRVLTGLLLTAALTAGAVFGYFGIYYRAGDEAASCLEGDERVRVLKERNFYLFDGPGQAQACLFFGGAKVEEESYAPLLRELAEGGIDCCLVRSPFRMAFLGAGRGREILERCPYEHWMIAGHSLGGTVASVLAAEEPRAEILLLLAAYPSGELSDGQRICAVYGSEDSVLNREAYEAARELWPEGSAELVIPGGNHAGFGDYGPQRGDGVSSIGARSQWEETAQWVLSQAGTGAP